MGTPTPGIVADPADRRYRLAEVILAESERAGLRAGSRLPTERQLAADLGATRTSVRRALAVLEAEGRISREVGRGTFLRDAPWHSGAATAGGPGQAAGQDGGHGARGPGQPAEAGGAPGAWDAPGTRGTAGARGAPGEPGAMGFAPADVMAIRRLLEPPAMRLVVAWATAADFGEMDRCLAGGERAASYDEFELWDLALHRTILAASHSPLLTRLYAVIEEARHGRFWGDLKRRSASRERQHAYQCDHQELVAALRARDADRAVAAMRAHLARVASHLFD
jgi:GntR family uxuAB operon transcriptional repressor